MEWKNKLNEKTLITAYKRSEFNAFATPRNSGNNVSFYQVSIS